MKLGSARLIRLAALGLVCALGTAAPAGAAYPDKPVTLVVPFPPGGAVDTLGRIFAERIAAQTGQSVIVENRPGANGNIGTEMVAKAAPDGYTVLIAANGFATNPTFYPKRSIDETKDLRPVAYVGYAPLIMVVGAGTPYQRFEDLLQAARAKPGSVTYATSGNGSAPHLASELLRITTNTDLVHVPYKGGPPAKVDLVAGRVSFMFLNPLEVVSQVEAGKLRALMVDSPQRLKQLPDVPTARELGYPELEAKVWWGFAVPKGTPDDVVEALNRQVNDALSDPQVRRKLDEMAVTSVGGSVESFETFYRDQVAKWADVVKKAGIAIE